MNAVGSEAWLREQDAATDAFLRECPALQRCRDYLESRRCTVDPPWLWRRGKREFFLVQPADSGQPVLCVRGDAGSQKVLCDPNALGLALDHHQISVSPSGRYVALQLAPAGEPLAVLHVFDATTGGLVEKGDFTSVVHAVAWRADERSYYYSLCRRIFDPEGGGRADGVYQHELGADWSRDPCVRKYEGGKGHLAYATVVEGDEWLLLHTHHFSSGCSGVSVGPIQGGPQVPLFDEVRDYVEFLGQRAGELYFQTTRDAERGCVVSYHPARAKWRTVVAHGDAVLGKPERFPGLPKAALGEDSLLLTCVEHAHDVVHRYSLRGDLLQKLSTPQPSTINAVFAEEDGFRICAETFLVPRITYALRDGALREVERRVAGTEPEHEVRQLFVKARDGAEIPLYVVYRRGLTLDGRNPLLLYAYGGFGQSITPQYRPDAEMWLQLGGVYAVANVRGGGEYGETWHVAGSRERKQTTFDDFYDVAEFLVAQRYTAPSRLVARGLSNGGLLTAVCANQRPDLFAALLTSVPITDMLWLGDSAVGQAIAAEYGSPRDGDEMRRVLESYSPLQNVRADPRSPPQLVVIAERDSSAPPERAFEYVAARQAAARSAGAGPVLMRLVRDEGHTDWPDEVTRRVLAEEIAFAHRFAF